MSGVCPDCGNIMCLCDYTHEEETIVGILIEEEKYEKLKKEKDERIKELESDVESFQLLAKEWKERCEELKAENYRCGGSNGTQPTNECCGGCAGCIEMQMIHALGVLEEANEKLKEQANRRVIHRRLSGENKELKEVIRVCLAIQSLWLPDESLEYCGAYIEEARALGNMKNRLEKALGENE